MPTFDTSLTNHLLFFLHSTAHVIIAFVLTKVDVPQSTQRELVAPWSQLHLFACFMTIAVICVFEWLVKCLARL